MVALPVGAVDTLAVHVADARTEAHADHGEGGEIDLGIAVGVGVVFFEVEIAFVVEDAVEDEGCVAVGAFDGSTVERRVVVGNEGPRLLMRRPQRLSNVSSMTNVRLPPPAPKARTSRDSRQRLPLRADHRARLNT